MTDRADYLRQISDLKDVIGHLGVRDRAMADLLREVRGGIIEGTADDVDAWEARRATLIGEQK